LSHAHFTDAQSNTDQKLRQLIAPKTEIMNEQSNLGISAIAILTTSLFFRCSGQFHTIHWRKLNNTDALHGFFNNYLTFGTLS
jgi:hypothetical protein